MEITLGEVARLVNGKLVGEDEIKIYGVAEIQEAGAGQLSFLANPKYKDYLKTTRASAVIVSSEIQKASCALIQVKNPYLALARVLNLLAEATPVQPEIHPSAVLGKSVKLGKNIVLGAYTVVEGGAIIGDETVVYPQVYIGRNVRIGEGTLIYPQVTIRENCEIGNRVIIHSGVVIGGDGFGYAEESGRQYKIPQVGKVVIEDEVEIGAGTTVDRATLGETRIGQGTKVDNLVQIAHNVKIGKGCVIVAQVAVAGSTRIGDYVVIGGQAALAGHLKIGDRVMIAAKSGVTKDLAGGARYSGFPARLHQEDLRFQAQSNHVPILIRRIKELEKKLGSSVPGN